MIKSEKPNLPAGFGNSENFLSRKKKIVDSHTIIQIEELLMQEHSSLSVLSSFVSKFSTKRSTDWNLERLPVLYFTVLY